MIRAITGLLRDRRGATAVEFALVAGPLLVLVLGSVELGRALWGRQALQEIAVSAARCAAVPQTACTTNKVYDKAKAQESTLALAGSYGVGIEKADIGIEKNTTCNGVSGFTKVTVTYDFSSPLKPLLASLVDGINLSAVACYPEG